MSLSLQDFDMKLPPQAEPDAIRIRRHFP